MSYMSIKTHSWKDSGWSGILEGILAGGIFLFPALPHGILFFPHTGSGPPITIGQVVILIGINPSIPIGL